MRPGRWVATKALYLHDVRLVHETLKFLISNSVNINIDKNVFRYLKLIVSLSLRIACRRFFLKILVDPRELQTADRHVKHSSILKCQFLTLQSNFRISAKHGITARTFLADLWHRQDAKSCRWGGWIFCTWNFYFEVWIRKIPFTVRLDYNKITESTVFFNAF